MQALTFIEKRKRKILVSLTHESIEKRAIQTLSILDSIDIEETDIEGKRLREHHRSEISTFLTKYEKKENALSLIENTLIELANQGHTNLKKINRMYDQSFLSKVLKSVALIEAIQQETQQINLNIVINNLKLFPNLALYFGANWFEEKCLETNQTHDLIELLSRIDLSVEFLLKLKLEYDNEDDQIKKSIILDKIEKLFYVKLRLTHINNCLNILQIVSRGKERLVKRLKNEDEYYQTLSEIELGNAIGQKHPISLQEKIQDRPLDILVFSICNRQLIIEVTSLTEIQKLKLMGIVPNMKNKVKSIILDKISNQISRYSKVDIPIVIAVDNTRAREIEVEDVYHALHGSPGVEILTNEDDMDNPYSFRSVRMQDSINKTTEFGKILSAVIIYHSEVSITKELVWSVK